MANTMVRGSADAARADRHAARRVLWDESRDERRRKCGRTSVVPGSLVAVKASGSVAGGDRRGGFGGLATCGSVWACPVCSAQISSRRQEQLAAAVRAWEAQGGRVALVTVTNRHRSGQRLRTLWDATAYAWGKSTSGAGRAYARDCSLFGVAGWARIVEVTEGKNGWHVHVHALFFLKGADQLLEVEPRLFGESLFGRWSGALTRKGLEAPIAHFHEGPHQECRRSDPHYHGGLDVTLLPKGDSEKVAAYLSKSVYRQADDPVEGLAWEMAGGGLKRGRQGNRTPFQILRDVVDVGDADDLETWHEWERECNNRRQLTWSTGMRELLNVEDVTDEEIVEEDQGGDVVAILEPALWVAWRSRATLLLEAVEVDDDGTALRALLGLPPPIH